MIHRHISTYFFCSVALVTGQVPEYVLKGQEINIVPSISGEPDFIRWTHNGSPVVEFNGMEEVVFGRYKNRITLDWTSAELTVSEVTSEDRGIYEVEADINKRLQYSSHTLEVIDRVTKPTISCEVHDSNNTSGIQATLNCSADAKRAQPLKFEWSSNGKMEPGSKLLISLGGKHDDEVYACNVSNPLTTEGATFSARDCYHVSSPSIELIVSLVILALILAVLVLGFVFRKKLKACLDKEKKSDLEKQIPADTTGSNNEENQGEESICLLHSAPTLPSNHQLRPFILNERDVEHHDPKSSQRQGSQSDPSQEPLVAGNDDKDAGSAELTDPEEALQSNSFDLQKTSEIDTAAPVEDLGSDMEADEGRQSTPVSDGVPLSVLSNHSSLKLQEDSNSVSTEKNVTECDSSGDDDNLYTSPEQNISDLDILEVELQEGDFNHQEMDTTVARQVKECNSERHQEVKDVPGQQEQPEGEEETTILANPDNCNPILCEVPPVTAPADLDGEKEGVGRHEPEEPATREEEGHIR